MKLLLQEPNSGLLLNHISKAATNANSGAAVFAFASRAGIEALFAQPSIQALAGRELHLFVGLDAITNVDALDTLTSYSDQHANLSTWAFYNDVPGSLFHPKFSWFDHGEEIVLITGSGNLTPGGLGYRSASGHQVCNWEAFTETRLASREAQALRQQWDAWLDDQRLAGRLRALSDTEVLARAIENGRLWRAPKRIGSSTKPGAPAVQALPPIQDVFITEIPSGSTRWNQANFHVADFESFFGFGGKSGHSAGIILQSVDPNGATGSPEIRLPVRVKSKNYRVELSAGRGLLYETTNQDDRPIAVFVRIDPRAFRYCLLRPSDHGYQSVLTILGPISAGRRLMRRAIIDTRRLHLAWQDAPDALFPSQKSMPEI